MIKPMLCNEYVEGKVPLPCFVQPKLDGVRCLAGEHEVYTRNQKPHKEHIQRTFDIATDGDEDFTFDGELMLPGASFQQTVSAVKKESERSKELVYNIYDFCWHRYPGLDFTQRTARLEEIVEDILEQVDINLQFVFTKWVETQEELDETHALFLSQGYEGTIIRDPFAAYAPGSRRYMWKRKDFVDAEYEIIDVWEGKDAFKGMAVFRCPRPNYKVGDEVTKDNSFGATAPGTLEEKRGAWLGRGSYIGKCLTVKFFDFTDDGVPRFPVSLSVRDYE